MLKVWQFRTSESDLYAMASQRLPSHTQYLTLAHFKDGSDPCCIEVFEDRGVAMSVNCPMSMVYQLPQ